MSSPPASPGLRAISVERRMTLLFGLYVVALFSVVCVIAGTVTGALFMILIGELLLSMWRPTPVLGHATYNAPAGKGWEAPITAMRWYVIIRTAGALAWGAFAVTAFFVFFIFVAMKPTGLSSAGYIVLALYAAWLASRWFWSPPLVQWIGRSFSNANKPRIGPIQVGVDGLNIVVAQNLRGRSYVIQVAYGEIEEMRLLSWLDADAYWESVALYDPSLAARATWELMRFIQGELPRPTIIMFEAEGTNLLIRGPKILYLAGWADQTGPVAIEAWQAWRAAHQAEPAPAS